ncbi:family 65 glycosyl hydrolase domain-containing protein [Clostridiaceae bacterium HSG29]|nr:family 65 glycosyl hydrolase domain-containing protein [Clostridiaceae bacterium HSG29]
MKRFIEIDPWKIIQNGFDEKNNEIYESLMSLGNGHMGMRGNLEENFTGNTLKGTYVAGVYYPDKTRVGWWKNGYPEYFAKVLNSTNLIGIDIKIDNVTVDLNKTLPIEFKRELDMQSGTLKRSFKLNINNKKFKIEVIRFLSMQAIELGAINYSITSLDNYADIEINSYLDGNVTNKDSNYDEYFWEEINTEDKLITLKTKKLDFKVTSSMGNVVNKDIDSELNSSSLYTSETFSYNLKKDETITLHKFITVVTNRDYNDYELNSKAKENIKNAINLGFDSLLKNHIQAWIDIWASSDILIEGDDVAQQGIRFNIFHLMQTYHGHDARLNIGPKGFTGEKYGGSTYWDTEAYCLPFYLSTSDKNVSKNLLEYRYKHLDRAIENAQKLGLDGALYPMVTMNGEECHNEWEITFEEIHRNGAIAYAIYNYINYTGDIDYLNTKGLNVLIEIAKFWADRVHYSENKKQYVMHGVTGPNEYENNINNNWYTSKIAIWTMKYAIESMEYVKETDLNSYNELLNKIKFNENETVKWQDIIDNMYFGYDKEKGIFLQQDGYLDKEQLLVSDIPENELPLVHNWSWDKILRSPFIKQADVLQGMFLFEDEFTHTEMKNNFDYYEPRTVHESSLSPCIYSIIAGDIGYEEKAYELYLRTSRLDLENYNSDTEDGLHITSMAGTWMSIIYGFGRFRIKNNKITLNPFTPENWNSYSFKILFRDNLLSVTVKKEEIEILLEKGTNFDILVYNKEYKIDSNSPLIVKIK